MMKTTKLFFLLFSCCWCTTIQSQEKSNHAAKYSTPVNGTTIFKVDQPDYTISPFTGMTRQNWKDAALYLLEGAFSYIHNPDDPMKFPKQPGKSYPRSESQIPTEKLEGLCRTLFMAAPLLKEDPSLQINGINVAAYYRHNILKLVDSSSTGFIKPRGKNGGPSQNLVEFGALSVSLFAIPNILWDPLTPDQKNALAATMLSYGDGPTVGSNWKFFNIFILSFFKEKGYAVNEKLLLDYLDKSLAHYRGNGWYNDAPAYDYYSMWAFQMYGPLWSEYFGKKYYPQYAEKFMNNFKEVKYNYPYLFGKDGTMIMWGRSMSYRMGSVIPFPLMGLENNPTTNYGWMRRIASHVILQFLQQPDFLQDDIPTLGFYGAFEPAVQPYSCRGSVFWMGKVFLGLLIPADNIFWTATENEGAWNKELKKGNVYNRYADSAHILITDYSNIGASEIRAWCKAKAVGANEPFRSSENYNRLSYNSAFPWQADSSNGTVAMNYVFKNKNNQWEPLRLFDFKKYNNGMYYRDAVLETNSHIKLNLVDIPLPNGILRIDRIISDTVTDLRLGHYALPKLVHEIKETKIKVKGNDVTIIDNGVYQLAMVTLKGWLAMEVMNATGLHPESRESKVIDTPDRLTAADTTGKVYITALLWKRSGEAFTDAELNPVKKYTISANLANVVLKMGNKKKYIVEF
jgi:hypothetical protein